MEAWSIDRACFTWEISLKRSMATRLETIQRNYRNYWKISVEVSPWKFYQAIEIPLLLNRLVVKFLVVLSPFISWITLLDITASCYPFAKEKRGKNLSDLIVLNYLVLIRVKFWIFMQLTSYYFKGISKEGSSWTYHFSNLQLGIRKTIKPFSH